MNNTDQSHDELVALAQKVLDLVQARPNKVKGVDEGLIRSIRALHVAAEGPAHYVIRQRHQPLEFISILMAMETGVLQAIVARDGSPISAAELSPETNTEELLIIRIMRLLTAVNICDEVGIHSYGSNPVTIYLNAPGQREGMNIVAEMLFPIASSIRSHMRAGNFYHFPDPRDKEQKNPFQLTFGRSSWEWLRDNPEQRDSFDAYMAARRNGLRPEWFEIYPAHEEFAAASHGDGPEKVLLVDVGGNHGYDVLNFQRRYPEIRGRFVLQDLPENVAGIQTPLSGVDVMPYDFFTEQPVKGARAYLFKSVCHDFSDQQCHDFLSNTARSMNSDSSMLIDDCVLPDAEAPLLGASEDMMMMMLLSGMERTLTQWKDLLDSVGLKIVSVWRSESARESVIEAKLKLLDFGVT